MKKLLFFALIALSIAACEKKEKPSETTDVSTLEAIANTEADLPDGLKSKHVETLRKTLPESISSAEVYRIVEKLSIGWHGVTGCCGDDRINSSVSAKFNAWVGQKMLENPNLSLMRYGHGGGEVRCNQRNSGWPDNTRSCSGGVSVEAYIEFYRP